MQPTIAQLFDPRGGASCISDRCDVCNELLNEENVCEVCLTESNEEEE